MSLAHADACDVGGGGHDDDGGNDVGADLMACH